MSVNYHPSGRVIIIKSKLYIPSAENNFPPVASASAEGTQYAAANFNLSKYQKFTPSIYIIIGIWKFYYVAKTQFLCNFMFLFAFKDIKKFLQF